MRRLCRILFVFCLTCLGEHCAEATEILFPLNREAYQTNELIDISVIRSSEEKELAAGELTLRLSGADGSSMTFVFNVNACSGKQRTEHLHVNGRLLRPGTYTIQAMVDGQEAKTQIDVYSHIRRSNFKLINWGRAKEDQLLVQGEDNIGFNLFYDNYRNSNGDDFIRAGIDYMPNCVMGGGHQMDLRNECDWSDPYVIRGGTRRAVRQVFIERTKPNVPGIHFYDEPGLTWNKHAVTGEMTPHGIKSQVMSYESAFGTPAPEYWKINAGKPDDVAIWEHWAKWKLGFMDAAWQDSQFGVSYVRPDYLSVTQSQYAFSAFTDGYYFNVARSLPVVSGHGGYHDWGPGYFNPSMTLEFSRARDFDKPCWYLPTWYGNTPSDLFRLEQYLSFQTNIQGMISPPDLEPAQNASARQGIVESNHLMGRLGTIFTTMPVTRPPVALLFSLSHNIYKQTHDMTYNYAHSGGHGANIYFTYLAGKLLQHQFLTILDEDIVDGTLAVEHKAVILTSIDYLDPKVVAALEDFIADGGLVLKTGDCQVRVTGAVDLGIVPGFPEAEKVARLLKEGKNEEANKLTRMRQALAGAAELAAAVKPHLERAGIKPVFECDQPGIVATRQAAGDIEYLFAVNAAHDPLGDPMLGLKAVQAEIGIPDDGRPVYDAILGGPDETFSKSGTVLQGQFRFGPGQIRVFARTTRPIGSIRVGKPVLKRSYTRSEMPLGIDIGATLLDKDGKLLSGSAPLRIVVTDPLGVVRFDLYRATANGLFTASLPLAVNDPAGLWKVEVEELLANNRDTASFEYGSVGACGATAGATWRAVYFGRDHENIKRFVRSHQAVTIVKGTTDYCAEAADRLAKILKPWDVECKIVEAGDVNKARKLTEQEARTWIGLNYAGRGQIEAGDGNPAEQAGFAMRGHVVLIGNPDDNPLIAYLLKEKFLPYRPNKDNFPGPGRGMLAWQRDAIGANQESVALIAYDAEGMNEAVGSFYEAAAAIDPLTPLIPPSKNSISVATKANIAPEANVVLKATVPDRVVALSFSEGKLKAVSHDGTVVTIPGNTGEIDVTRNSNEPPAQTEPTIDQATIRNVQDKVGPSRMVKNVIKHAGLTAVTYWGGTIEFFDKNWNSKLRNSFSQDITAVTSVGDDLVFGLADSRIYLLKVTVE